MVVAAALSSSSSPEVQFLRKALASFWVLFFSLSVVADLNLIPGLSPWLRAVAKRGKDDDDAGDEEEKTKTKTKTSGDSDGVGGSEQGAPAAARESDCKGEKPVASSKTPRARRGAVSSSSEAWWTVPHGWFAHFYVLGTCWNALLLLHVLNAADKMTSGVRAADLERGLGDRAAVHAATSCALTAILFQVHVTRRLAESLAVSKYRPGARMHILGYVLGLVYYVAAPLTLLSTGAMQSVLDAAASAFDATGDAPLVALGDGYIDVKGAQTWQDLH